jgi:hypothetical protein
MVQLTKQNTVSEGRSRKEVRWNRGFAEIHEQEVSGGLSCGGTGLGPLYTTLFLGVGLDNCGHLKGPRAKEVRNLLISVLYSARTPLHLACDHITCRRDFATRDVSARSTSRRAGVHLMARILMARITIFSQIPWYRYSDIDSYSNVGTRAPWKVKPPMRR